MSELRRITERYRLDRQVSASDAGSVFHATDLRSGETVAVKLIHSDGGESEEQRERFLETVRTLQSLQHPCIPRVVDFGFTTAGSAYLVTEYLEGSRFEDLAGSPPRRVLSLLLLLVDGLEAMARQGLYLRNLRAENLLVVPDGDGEQIKIVGLGSAALEPGALPVLDGYAEDFHAFGILACRMLRAQTSGKVGVPLEVAVELEDVEALRALLDAALRGDPEGLYPNYGEVRKALRRALFGATGRKAIPRQEPFATRPGVETDSGTQAGTVVVRRNGDGWDVVPPAPPELPEPPPVAPQPPEAVPAVPGGTVILNSSWAGIPPVPPPEPRRVKGLSLDSTMELTRDDLGLQPKPPQPSLEGTMMLSESRAGGTARIQIPPEPSSRELAPPVLPEPEPPAAPGRRLPETTEIPVVRLQPPPEPPRRTGTAETPLAFAREAAAPRPAPRSDRSDESLSATAPRLRAVPPPEPEPVVPPVPEVPELPQPVVVEPEPRWTPPPAPVARPAPAVETMPIPMPAPAPAPPELGEETIARPPEVRVVPPAARRQRQLLWIVGGAVAAVLVLGVSLGLLLAFLRKPAPPPKPKPVVVAKPVAPPPVTPPPAPAPLPVHPQIITGETFLGAGDLNGVKTALDAITPAEQAAFRPDELDRYQRLVAALTPLKREELADQLSRGLERGDLRQLRTAAGSVPAAEEAGLTPDLQKSLARARKALDLDSRLSRAQRAGNPLEVIRLADALLQELPRASRAAEQKESAAGTIETAADSEIDAGQFDAALNRLNGLRQVWPDRSGLPARIDRVAAERKADQDLEALLASVSRAEKSNKPQDGLQLLAGVKPNHRYAARFQETRQRLEGEVAQLDRQAPTVATRGTVPEYEKGKTATVPLRITDDLGVKSVEGWARAEGGQYEKVNVRHLSGSDYALDVPPELHQNKTVEFYVTASDGSGHTGQLGSADRPIKVKRKSWFEKILRKKEGG